MSSTLTVVLSFVKLNDCEQITDEEDVEMWRSLSINNKKQMKWRVDSGNLRLVCSVSTWLLCHIGFLMEGREENWWNYYQVAANNIRELWLHDAHFHPKSRWRTCAWWDWWVYSYNFLFFVKFFKFNYPNNFLLNFTQSFGKTKQMKWGISIEKQIKRKMRISQNVKIQCKQMSWRTWVF